MKKRLKYYIMVLLISVFTSIGLGHNFRTSYGEDNLTKYIQEQNSQMNIMMELMKSIKPTKDAAIDYLNGMIPHHQAAVEMSNSLLKYGGKNVEVRDIAQNIIKAQTKEIQQMKDMIKQMEVNPQINEKNDAEYLKEYYDMLNKSMMDDKMSKANNVDEAFIIGMINHHQMAIDMSELILKYTDNKEVVNLAKNIIKAQKSEIEKMKSLI